MHAARSRVFAYIVFIASKFLRRTCNTNNNNNNTFVHVLDDPTRTSMRERRISGWVVVAKVSMRYTHTQKMNPPPIASFLSLSSQTKQIARDLMCMCTFIFQKSPAHPSNLYINTDHTKKKFTDVMCFSRCCASIILCMCAFQCMNQHTKLTDTASSLLPSYHRQNRSRGFNNIYKNPTLKCCARVTPSFARASPFLGAKKGPLQGNWVVIISFFGCRRKSRRVVVHVC